MTLSDYIPPILMERMLLPMAERWLFFRAGNKEILKKNGVWKNAGAGKRAFLLATGPSIKQEDLSVLSGEDCFSLSNFFLHEKIKTINPVFHFFAPYHEPLDLNDFIVWMRNADQELPPSTKVFLGLSDKPLVEKHRLFSNREVFYLHFSNTPYFKNKVDLQFPVLKPISGPLMILPVLIYMGYKEIYLLGCDHTVMRDYKKNITHFYDNTKDVRKNASDINSWEGIINSHKYSLAVFLQYLFYKTITHRSKKTTIINLSQDTWLDFFDQKPLQSIVHDYTA